MLIRKQITTICHLTSCLILLLVAPTVVSAATPANPWALLFDFEGGVPDWRGNSWGAGKAHIEATVGARFGIGAMRLVYEGTTNGASVIAPYFSERVAWRGKPWGGLSFWARCLDDHLHKVNLQIETSQKDGGFSADFTLQGRAWQRYEATTASVWNREGLRIDWGAMKRFFFVSYASAVFEVDHIVLEPVARVVPLDVNPVAVCPRVAQAPKVDGVLDDACWALAGRLDRFVEQVHGKPARYPAEVRLCYNPTHLFVGTRLSLVDTDKVWDRATDNKVLGEDALKLIFRPEGNTAYYELALNPLGKLSDRSGLKPLALEADWEVKTSQDTNGWTAEVAIPFRSLALAGGSPAPGTSWDFDVNREIPTLGETSGWAITKGFVTDRDRWGCLLFVGSSLPAAPGPQPTLLELDYGEYAVRWAAPEGMTRAQLATCIHARGEEDSWTVSQAVTTERTSLEESLIRLTRHSSSPATARWHFSALNTSGEVVAYANDCFPVFPSEKPRPKPLLALLPQPKEVRWGQGRFVLPGQTAIGTVGLLPEDAGNVTRALIEPMRKEYGLEWVPGTGGASTLILAEKPEQLSQHFPTDRATTFASLPEEGYLLEVTERSVVIAGKSARGVFYGVQTFLQTVGLSTPLGERPVCPVLWARDYPSLPVRAVSVGFPNDRWGHPNDAPFEPERLEDYLERTLVRHKINTLVLIVNQAIRLDRHPELAAPQAWSKAQVSQVLDFARRRYLEVIPLVTVLGHADWFTLHYPELREEGDNLIACVSNPKTQQILTDVVSEVADLFKPKRFHLGMDEAWWKTLDLPVEKRCSLCAGKPKSELFASHLLRYHRLLKARGIETMIWGDMLLPEHNGGAPYDTARALETLPRDIILCNWSTGVVPLSSKRFQDAGFRVIQSNSADINRQQACWVIGNMMGCWSKAPWLALTTTDVQEFSYLAVVQSAERAWNPNANLHSEAGVLSREFLDNHAAAALTLVARSPAPLAAGPAQPVSLEGVANLSTKAAKPATSAAWFGLSPTESLVDLPEGKVTVAGFPFTLLPTARFNAVTFKSQPIVIPIKGKKGALAFLYGCHLPKEVKGKFLERFKQKEAILGVLIGTLRVRYIDNTLENVELRYGLNVLAWKLGEKMLPYCYGAVGSLLASTADQRVRDPHHRDAAFFACDWANPHPDKEIVSIEIVSANTEAIPFLLALTAWPAR